MYTNPRRINRNAKLGQLEAVQTFSAMAIECVRKGADGDAAGLFAAKAWHAMTLAGTEAVKAAKRKNY